jgi:hypothetical protein
VSPRPPPGFPHCLFLASREEALFVCNKPCGGPVCLHALPRETECSAVRRFVSDTSKTDTFHVSTCGTACYEWYYVMLDAQGAAVTTPLGANQTSSTLRLWVIDLASASPDELAGTASSPSQVSASPPPPPPLYWHCCVPPPHLTPCSSPGLTARVRKRGELTATRVGHTLIYRWTYTYIPLNIHLYTVGHTLMCRWTYTYIPLDIHPYTNRCRGC